MAKFKVQILDNGEKVFDSILESTSVQGIKAKASKIVRSQFPEVHAEIQKPRYHKTKWVEEREYDPESFSPRVNKLEYHKTVSVFECNKRIDTGILLTLTRSETYVS